MEPTATQKRSTRTLPVGGVLGQLLRHVLQSARAMLRQYCAAVFGYGLV